MDDHSGEIDADELWELANCMLDLVYLRMDAVYDQIVVEVFGSHDAVLGYADISCASLTMVIESYFRDRMIHLKADYFLIVAGVAATSCVSLRGLEFADEVSDCLLFSFSSVLIWLLFRR